MQNKIENLKAMAYDLLVSRDMTTAKLNEVNQEIARLLHEQKIQEDEDKEEVVKKEKISNK